MCILGAMKDTKKTVVKLSPNETDGIDSENIDLLLQQSIARFNEVRRDKESNQLKAGFVLTLIGFATALLVVILTKQPAMDSWVSSILRIEVPILLVIGGLILQFCVLPSYWISGGLSISDAWQDEKVRLMPPKLFKVFYCHVIDDRIDYNIDCNEKMAGRLIQLASAAILSPLISAAIAFVIRAVSPWF